MVWFASEFASAAPKETLAGIDIVRAGRQWTVHWEAMRRYRRRLRGAFDVVVDEVNTIPFFTPLWADVPVVMLIHQLAREVWWYESGFPVNVLGFLAEAHFLRAYRNVPVVTVSASTSRDLRSLGFRGEISIVPQGLEPIPPTTTLKEREPMFLYVGRLSPSKRIEHALEALALFRKATGHGSLTLVGSGPDKYKQSLVRRVHNMGLESSVTFSGRVSPIEKCRLMASSHCLLVTSVREGWGLVVSEANAVGIPAIVYDVPGLRDSVRNESTGLIVPPRPSSMANAMLRLSEEPELYVRLAAEGQRWSSTLSFDTTASRFREVLAASASK